MKIVLPWPPTLNTYWRNVQGRTLLSKQGRQYRRRVGEVLAGQRYQCLNEPVQIDIRLYPPDRRKIDIDNRIKALLDNLQRCRVIEDDCLVDVLSIRRCEVYKGGKVELVVEALADG